MSQLPITEPAETRITEPDGSKEDERCAKFLADLAPDAPPEGS